MSAALSYLASPFTADDPAIREARFEAACRAAAELIRQGRNVFSPIAHSVAICRYGLPLDWRFWQRIDLQQLAMCSDVIVLQLDGWQRSVGVKAEIAAARTMGKPVTFVLPSDLGVADVLVSRDTNNADSQHSATAIYPTQPARCTCDED